RLPYVSSLCNRRSHVQGIRLTHASFASEAVRFSRLGCRMDTSGLCKTALVPSSGSPRHAASLVTPHRCPCVQPSSSQSAPNPLMLAGRPHSAQAHAPCSLRLLERGVDRCAADTCSPWTGHSLTSSYAQPGRGREPGAP